MFKQFCGKQKKEGERETDLEERLESFRESDVHWYKVSSAWLFSWS